MEFKDEAATKYEAKTLSVLLPAMILQFTFSVIICSKLHE